MLPWKKLVSVTVHPKTVLIKLMKDFKLKVQKNMVVVGTDSIHASVVEDPKICISQLSQVRSRETTTMSD